MKKKKTKKYLISITTVIIILFVIQYVEGEIIKNLDSEIIYSSNDLFLKHNEVLNGKSNLDYINFKLQENYSDLKNLKSGDKYNLHNPMYSEVMEFINLDDSNSISKMIENAKNKGIRCAYVMIYVGSSLSVYKPESGQWVFYGGGMYPLIGFNTINQGMLYFEALTDYQVIPTVGQFYTDCVVGNPYLPDTSNNITDILEIW